MPTVDPLLQGNVLLDIDGVGVVANFNSVSGVSSRMVPNSRLDDAFRRRLRKKAHRKTGEIDLPDGKYIVPDETLFGEASSS